MPLQPPIIHFSKAFSNSKITPLTTEKRRDDAALYFADIPALDDREPENQWDIIFPSLDKDNYNSIEHRWEIGIEYDMLTENFRHELDDSAFDEQQQQQQLAVQPIADPIVAIADNLKSMEFNAALNTAVIAALVVAVLTKIATVDIGIMDGWTLEEMIRRIPVDNWNDYNEFLAGAPVLTKAITSATVYAIGDFLSQRAGGASMGSLDRGRILRSLIAGLVGHGPGSHVWYNFSEGLFNDVLHCTAWWSFVPKIILDQTTWGPIWNNSYIVLIGLMKQDNWKTIWSDMKRTTVPLIVSGLKLWPLAHCVTYGLIPVENRLLWVDTVEILWVTILATQASSSGNGRTHGAEPEIGGAAVRK